MSTRLLLSVLITIFSCYPLSALVYTWEGDVSTSWGSAGNWDLNSGSPNRDDDVIFDTPGTFDPDITGTKNEALTVTFNQAGNSVFNSGGTSILQLWGDQITSNGAGLNFIERLATRKGTTFDIGAGNILQLGPSVDSQTSGLQVTAKNGPGTLLAYAASSAFPDINAGSYILNGSHTSGGFGTTRTVADGALFGGTAVVWEDNSADYIWNSGATLAPGASGIGDEAAGVLTFKQDRETGFRDFEIFMEAGSVLAIDVFADGTSDSVHFTGLSTLSQARLDIADGVTLALNGTPANATYTIATFDGAGTFSGEFQTITLAGVELTEGVDYNMTYTPHPAFDPGTGSIAIELMTIPEPRAFALMAGLAALGIGLHVRRKRGQYPPQL